MGESCRDQVLDIVSFTWRTVNDEKPKSDSHYAARDSNQSSSEYKSEALPLCWTVMALDEKWNQ